MRSVPPWFLFQYPALSVCPLLHKLLLAMVLSTATEKQTETPMEVNGAAAGWLHTRGDMRGTNCNLRATEKQEDRRQEAGRAGVRVSVEGE